MKQIKKYRLILSIAFLALAFIVALILKSSLVATKQCPDHLYGDAMPGPETEGRKMYYTVRGQRHEYGEYDPYWVEKNCSTIDMRSF